MTQAFLGIDVGTTGCKIIAIDEEGKVLDSEIVEYPIYTPRVGWTEQNPEDWWNAAKEAMRRIISRKRVPSESIQGIGLTGQMHGLVIIDNEEKIIRPAILWNDQRTFREAEFINNKFSIESIIKITGSIVQTGFTAPKLLWVKNNELENFRRIKKFMLPKDYVGFKLTGDVYTDVNDASGTSLFDVERRRWAEDLITELDLSPQIFPDVLESSEVRGEISKEVADELGLKPGTIVVAGAGDQGAAGVGAGAVTEGILSVNIGTSGVVFTSSDKYRFDPRGRLHAFCHASPSKWHLMGVMLAAGGSLRWFRDTFCQLEKIIGELIDEDPYNIIVREAAGLPTGSEGLIFLPYLSGERTPHADPYARGVFFGLSLKHGKGHIVRSILEGVAYGLMNSLELMREVGVTFSEVRLLGGGSRSLLWRRIIADVFGLRTSLLKVDEGSSYGAAILATVGVGVYRNVEDAVSEIVRTVEPLDPDLSEHGKYKKYYELYNRLYKVLKDEFRRLVEIM
ncbi:MAG: xylulokinase [Candidatus Caldarchaeales archaeon]